MAAPAIDPAVSSFGTEIQVRSSAAGVTPITWATIAGVGDIDGPAPKVNEQETTSHSTGVPWKTFVPSLGEFGTLSFPCYFNPSDPTHSLSSTYGLEHLFYARETTDWRLINTDQGRRTRQFKGFITEMKEKYPVDGINTKDTTIRISGMPSDVVPDITVLPTSASPTAAGGPATIAVTVVSSDGSTWFPVSNAPWITITGPADPQTANGTINYTVAAQQAGAPARSGQIIVAGVQIPIDQAAG